MSVANGRHLADAHDIEASSKVSASTYQSLSTQQRKDHNPHTTDSTIMWLGPFALCRSLGDKLAVPWDRFEPCAIHSIPAPDDCATCRLLEQLPVLPVRCHVSVAVSIPSAARSASTEEDKRLDDEDDAEFVILSTEDPRCGVAVDTMSVLLIRSRDGVALKSLTEGDGKRRRVSSRRSRLRSQRTTKKPPGEQTEIVFVQSAVLCRDARNEAWVIGHPFVSTERMDVAGPSKAIATGRETFFVADGGEPGYNVELDRSRIAVVRLRAAIGVTVVLDTLGVSRAAPAVSVDENSVRPATSVLVLHCLPQRDPFSQIDVRLPLSEPETGERSSCFARRLMRERITLAEQQLSL